MALGHDAKCESELTSHGYTPCLCHMRSMKTVSFSDRLSLIRKSAREGKRVSFDDAMWMLEELEALNH